MKRKFVVLSDFDGTISTVDVGDMVIKKFMKLEDGEKLEQDFRDKLIGSRDLYRRVYAAFTDTETEVIEFVKTFSLDRYFKSFVDFCRQHGIEFAVLSDGFQYYINALFDKYGISGVTVYCNNAHFNGNHITLDFPYGNPYCSECANCKAGAYLRYKDMGYTVIFVGDGFSDRYIAEKADIVFAKSHLAKYCTDNNIAYIAFDTFQDVEKHLVSILSDKC